MPSGAERPARMKMPKPGKGDEKEDKKKKDKKKKGKKGENPFAPGKKY